jgi:hypothetical protein
MQIQSLERRANRDRGVLLRIDNLVDAQTSSAAWRRQNSHLLDMASIHISADNGPFVGAELRGRRHHLTLPNAMTTRRKVENGKFAGFHNLTH